MRTAGQPVDGWHVADAFQATLGPLAVAEHPRAAALRRQDLQLPKLPVPPRPDAKGHGKRQAAIAALVASGHSELCRDLPTGWQPPTGRIPSSEAGKRSVFCHSSCALREADKLRHCKSKALVFSCENGDHAPRLLWRGCDSRLCPECSKRLGKRAKSTALAAVGKAVRAQTGGIAHGVFTLPNMKKLKPNELRELGKKVTKWFRRARVRDNVRAVYRRIEVTWDKERGWHPHVHMLLWIRSPKDRANRRNGVHDFGDMWRVLTLEWHALTGCRYECRTKTESLQPSDLEDAHHNPGCEVGGSFWWDSVRSVRGAPLGTFSAQAHEVTKYLTKGVYAMSSGPPPPLSELTLAIKGVRLGVGLGDFFKVRGVELEPEPMVCLHCHRIANDPDLEECPDAEMRYRGPPELLQDRAAELGPDSLEWKVLAQLHSGVLAAELARADCTLPAMPAAP